MHDLGTPVSLPLLDGAFSGAWSGSGPILEVRSPVDGSMAGRVRTASESDTERVLSAARVAFLGKGLRNAEWTLATARAYRDYRRTGALDPYVAALDALDAFRASLLHEQRVSASICAIYEMAQAEKDYPTLSFLKWFLDEQVEEEKNVGEMVARLELVGENHNGLLHLDQIAARRAAEAK